MTRKHGTRELISVAQPQFNRWTANDPQVAQSSGSIHSSAVLHRPLASSWDEIALSTFCKHFGCIPGFFEEACAGSARYAVQACTKALGLATYARTANNVVSTSEATRYYSSALSCTSAALATARHYHHDSLVVAAMLLMHLETVTSIRPDFNAWAAHINGSAALLKLRGSRQLLTLDGRILLMQVSMHLVTLCLRSLHRVPPEIHALANDAVELTQGCGIEKFVWVIHGVRLKVVDIYSDLALGELDDPIVLTTVLMDFDDELRTVSEHLEHYLRHSVSADLLRRWSLPHAHISAIVCRLILNLLVIRVLSMAAERRLQTYAEAAERTAVCETNVSELISILTLSAKAPYERMTPSESRIFENNPSVLRLFQPQPGAPSASSMLADQLLIISLCGTSILRSYPGEGSRTQSATPRDISWALLLIGRISNPSLYSAKAAPQLLRYMGFALPLQRAIDLAIELEGSQAG